MRLIGMRAAAFALVCGTASSQEDTAELASEAYIFGYPLVIMGLTEEVWLARGGLNQFDHLREFPDTHFAPS